MSPRPGSSPRLVALVEQYQALVAEVYEAAGALRRYGERIAGAAGQTQARWQLMSVVSQGDWTVPAAADRLGVSRQAVQRLANELVAEGLASFAVNPHHRRSPFFRLSDQGMEALAVILARAAIDHRTLAVALQLEGLDLGQMRSDLSCLTHLVRSQLETDDVTHTTGS